MDDRQFDSFVKSLAAGVSRRSVVRGVFGLAAGLVAGSAVTDAWAARRPTPTPKPVKCPGNQHWNGAACVCPDGSEACGPDCCPDGQATCCDNACCYGYCYGEELCCSFDSWCEASWECCGPDEVCCGESGCIPAGAECCYDAECGENAYCTAEHQCACDAGAIDCGAGCVVAECCGDGDCAEGQVCADGGCFYPCTYDGQQYSCPQCSFWQCLRFEADDTSYCVAPGFGLCSDGLCAPGWYCLNGYCAYACS